ncbi:TonB-dependent receptor [Odoribacter lunatus]|uniref:TonB-dependent receptor n=1 Tax=Odoribacter lunatus TaxID=2941335 RepID=UPI00203B7903|nr:TonB-dependent receptor [Odoribacter lunatus]
MRFIFSGILLFAGSFIYAQHTALLEEVVVMAEKRELKPQYIPAALTVITPEAISGENNPDLRNLSALVPNFYMQEGGLKLSTPLYVRGVGTVSGTPPVGLYVDGVPVFDKNAFIFDLYDIHQIEVLRGPQTTLYGRNSINGLVNVRTKAPARDFSAQAKLGYASYGSQSYQVLLNAPVGRLHNKFSFAYNKSEGYFKNQYDGYRKSNPSDSYNVRYQGNVYSDKSWKINFGANFNHSFDGGYAYHAVDSLRADRYVVNYNTPSSYKRDLFSSYINFAQKGRRLAFNWVTSYSWSKDKQLLDADFTYLDVFDNNKKSQQNLVTQELNLQSVKGKHVEWTLGAFGFYKNLKNDYLATFGKDKAYLLPMPLSEMKYYNSTLTYGAAGYGQITVKDIWPGVSVTAGLRYDYEKADLTYRDSMLIDRSPRFMSYHDSEENKKFGAWLPKFSILQAWNDKLSLYLNISKGYKAGGYNIIANDMRSQTADLGYGKEKLWNYEIGLKYFSPSRKFSLNAAAYYIDWQDQQIFVMGMMGPSIKNAGDARSFGGEADVQGKIFPHLSYFFSAGYTHSKYYRNDNKAHEGNRIVMAPEFTGNAGLVYQRPMQWANFTTFRASTSVTGMGTQYFDEDNLLKQSPYFLWNMDFALSGKYVSLHVWGKNILDKAFFSYMLNNPVGEKLPAYFNMGQSGAPARFGASVTFKI